MPTAKHQYRRLVLSAGAFTGAPALMSFLIDLWKEFLQAVVVMHTGAG